jgi:hypothetical protein
MMATRQKKKPKKATRHHHHPRPDFPVRGIVFDLCCGKMGVANGVGHNRGEYKVELDAHGFSVTILLSEDQATTLGKGLTECVHESKKDVN